MYCVAVRDQKKPKERGCWSPREDNEEAARFVGVPHCSSPVLVSVARSIHVINDMLNSYGNNRCNDELDCQSR